MIRLLATLTFSALALSCGSETVDNSKSSEVNQRNSRSYWVVQLSGNKGYAQKCIGAGTKTFETLNGCGFWINVTGRLCGKANPNVDYCTEKLP